MRNGTLAFLAALAVIGAGAPALAVLPEDIVTGARVEVEGHVTGPGEVRALEVQLKRSPKGDDEVEGPIGSVDPEARKLVIAGIKVVLAPEAEISKKGGGDLELSAFAAGGRAEAEGRFENGVLHAESLKLRDSDPDETRDVDLEGKVGAVDAARGSFRMFGLLVLTGPQTKFVLH